MSKKAVIVTKRKWCVPVDYDGTANCFYLYSSRSKARSQAFGLPVRKVTKIVYYYE